jgi:anti-anti-sigma factor
VSRAADEVTIALVGEVDISNEAAVGVGLAEILEMAPTRIAVDLAGLTYLDSSGVRCLLNVARRATTTGSAMVIRRPVGIVLRVLEICGVDELLLRGSDGDRSDAQ